MSAQCGDLLYVGRACTFWLKRSSGGEKEAEENIKVTGYRKKTNRNKSNRSRIGCHKNLDEVI